MNTGVKGQYQIEIFEDGKKVSDSGEFKNIITDHAFQYADPFSNGYLCIGLETNPRGSNPSKSDLELHNPTAIKAASFDASGEIIMVGAKRYTKKKVYAEFTGIEGRIAEVGFKKANDSASMISRSWVRDGNGLETVIPIKAIQTLKLSYFVYIELPEIITTGTVESTYGPVNFTIQPHAEVTAPDAFFSGKFGEPFGSGANAISLIIDGSTDPSNSAMNQSYDPATATTTIEVNFQAESSTRTILGLRATSNYKQCPMVYFDQPVSLPADNDLTFSMRFSWGRE